MGDILSGYLGAFTVGDIFTKTFAVFVANWRATVIYAVFVALLTSGLQFGLARNGGYPFSGAGLAATIAATLLSNIAGYVLVWHILDHLDFATTSFSGGRYFPYLGATIVMGIASCFGMLLLIVPGLLLMARWSAALPLITARGTGVFDAMAESWEMTRSRMWTIIGFYCLFGLVIMAITFPVMAGIGIISLREGLPTEVSVTKLGLQLVGSVLQNLVSGVVVCSSVALFALLLENAGAETEVFA
ncbi:glycerophosphoryl diester phosphodiesterase family protein [Novosphingobium sp. PhB165]|nr:glycerophosphoryl diester phosphodiesterase family protein [Novosphingobium sp. PhB165]